MIYANPIFQDLTWRSLDQVSQEHQTMALPSWVQTCGSVPAMTMMALTLSTWILMSFCQRTGSQLTLTLMKLRLVEDVSEKEIKWLFDDNWATSWQSQQNDVRPVKNGRMLGAQVILLGFVVLRFNQRIIFSSSPQKHTLWAFIWIVSARRFHIIVYFVENLKIELNHHQSGYLHGYSSSYMGGVKRIWYLSPMRAAKVQASLRICAVSPEPPLLARTSSESKGTFRQKARSLAPLNGWACAVKICHDGMLEDTNSLDGAHIIFMAAKCLRLCPGHSKEDILPLNSQSNKAHFLIQNLLNWSYMYWPRPRGHEAALNAASFDFIFFLGSQKCRWAIRLVRTASSEFGTYRLCVQGRFRRACASAQSRQNLRCSLLQAVSLEEPDKTESQIPGPSEWLGMRS